VLIRISLWTSWSFFDDSALTDGLRFTPRTPVRIADTRTGLGTPNAVGQSITVTITTPPGMAPSGTQALALNVAAILPSGWTFLTVVAKRHQRNRPAERQ
jgi:hypothetical protein